MKNLLYETDWLASSPFFYNEMTGRASHNINDVIDWPNVEIHPEGFNNYLDFGYSVLEQTPAKHVKFLRHSSRLWRDAAGRLSVEYLDDPVEKWWDYRLSESDIIDLIRERVQKWEASVDGEIVIPTSGGYDSRLLNWCIKDKSRVRAFTYGLSDKQEESYEAVYARKLCEILGIKWEQIFLGDFHRYLDDWDELFGSSTHAHGMYHFEFYQKILPDDGNCASLLSGVFGDVWAGSTNPPLITSCKQLAELGYTHGLKADVQSSILKTQWEMRQRYICDKASKFKEERWRVVCQIRLKFILISYLLTVPRIFCFKPWSPFLHVDVCMAMLNLPCERRRNRLWQQEFFQKEGIAIEEMNLKATASNTLNLIAMRRVPLRPLDVALLRHVVHPGYVAWINRMATRPNAGCDYAWLRGTAKGFKTVRGGWRLSNRISGILKKHDANVLKAYCAYLTLKPIETLLKKRNAARSST